MARLVQSRGAAGVDHMMPGQLRIGCAGWTIPKQDATSFPRSGSHLDRYAQRFAAVEINSSFHRPHRRTTYERWAGAVPGGFAFSVKAPKEIKQLTPAMKERKWNTRFGMFHRLVVGRSIYIGWLVSPNLGAFTHCHAVVREIRQGEPR